MKCEASSDSNFYKECGQEASFLIIDIKCKPISERFWVCKDCIKFFIAENLDNPHYIVLKEEKRINP